VFRVQCSGFSVQGLGFTVYGLGGCLIVHLRASNIASWIYDSCLLILGMYQLNCHIDNTQSIKIHSFYFTVIWTIHFFFYIPTTSTIKKPVLISSNVRGYTPNSYRLNYRFHRMQILGCGSYNGNVIPECVTPFFKVLFFEGAHSYL